MQITVYCTKLNAAHERQLEVIAEKARSSAKSLEMSQADGFAMLHDMINGISILLVGRKQNPSLKPLLTVPFLRLK